MRLRWSPLLFTIALGVAPTASANPPREHIGVIERVVAVVDHRVILLSELRARSKPFMLQIERTLPKEGAQRVAAEQEMKRDLLSKMIDEVLVAEEGKRVQITVGDADIDSALQTVATSQKLTVPQLLDASREAGLSEVDYRAELGRQLLEGKMVWLEVRPRIQDLASIPEAAPASP